MAKSQSSANLPRLPSPPPMAEDQVSPSSQNDEYGKLGMTAGDQGASRRIRPGTRSEDMQEGPPLVELQDIDSAFQYTEHLKALHNSYTHPIDSPSATIPIDKATAISLSHPPPGVDRGIWLYELCRFLTQKANFMAVGLFAETPPCSSTTCPEMRASEWQYLCAAHEPPKSCCAIDYCCHTLDWCATALTSTKLFPSRLALGTESASAQIQIRKMTEVFRRVYRIFAHAWFSHRDVFWRVETKTGLYVFFKTVCDEYRLIPEDNYTIPPEAEGIDATPIAQQQNTSSIMRRDQEDVEPAINNTIVSGNTTRKHRHTLSNMSDRSASVATVIHEEVDEDEEGEWSYEDEGDTTEILVSPELTREETLKADEATHPESVEGDASLKPENEDEETAPLSVSEHESDSEQREEEPSEPESSEQLDLPEKQETSTAEVATDETPAEPMGPTESAAGEAEDATKTVAD